MPADRRKRAGIVAFGVAAAIIAVLGGVLLGDYVSTTGSGDDSATRPISTVPVADDEPDSPLAPPPDIVSPLLPQIAIATRVAPDAERIPVAPESWLRQQDFPRQMFGEERVRGTIAISLTVAPDGSVSRCAIGAGSEVEPQRVMRATGTSVCRALQARAQFEPLPEPDDASAPPMMPGPSDEREEPALSPSNSPSVLAETSNPSENAPVSVRVIFTTVEEPSNSGPFE